MQLLDGGKVCIAEKRIFDINRGLIYGNKLTHKSEYYQKLELKGMKDG